RSGDRGEHGGSARPRGEQLRVVGTELAHTCEHLVLTSNHHVHNFSPISAQQGRDAASTARWCLSASGASASTAPRRVLGRAWPIVARIWRILLGNGGSRPGMQAGHENIFSHGVKME